MSGDNEERTELTPTSGPITRSGIHVIKPVINPKRKGISSGGNQHRRISPGTSATCAPSSRMDPLDYISRSKRQKLGPHVAIPDRDTLATWCKQGTRSTLGRQVNAKAHLPINSLEYLPSEVTTHTHTPLTLLKSRSKANTHSYTRGWPWRPPPRWD